jgi:hypothetical protein
MPNDQNSSQGRRQHYHRGRRGAERRASERRTPPNAPEAGQRTDHLDVEQIMRDIRARIAKRHGIDLSSQQIQELAARRLDAILEPRHVKPALMEQMRRAAGEPIDVPAPPPAQPSGFQEAALYESHRGIVRWLRKVLKPLLLLFFNPTPIARALDAQAQRNNEAAAREAEFYARQAEWNALHYELLQRLVVEISRNSLEAQNLTMRVESLAARVDFSERRVRGTETSGHQPPPRAPRAAEPAPQNEPRQPAAPSSEAAPVPLGSGDVPAAAAAGEGTRRRRRRRRGRRSGAGATGDAGANTDGSLPGSESDGDLEGDVEADESDAQAVEPDSPRPTPREAGAPGATASAALPAIFDAEPDTPAARVAVTLPPVDPPSPDTAAPPETPLTGIPPQEMLSRPETVALAEAPALPEATQQPDTAATPEAAPPTAGSVPLEPAHAFSLLQPVEQHPPLEPPAAEPPPPLEPPAAPAVPEPATPADEATSETAASEAGEGTSRATHDRNDPGPHER